MTHKEAQQNESNRPHQVFSPTHEGSSHASLLATLIPEVNYNVFSEVFSFFHSPHLHKKQLITFNNNLK